MRPHGVNGALFGIRIIAGLQVRIADIDVCEASSVMLK